MADKKQTPKPPETDAAVALRNKLIRRLMVAGGLVALLLAVLAFFDYLATPPEEAEAPAFSRPVPVAPKKEISQPVTPATNLPEPPTPEVSPPAAAEPPPPEVPAAPASRDASRPATPESRPVPAKPLPRPEGLETRPPTRSTASVPRTPSPRAAEVPGPVEAPTYPPGYSAEPPRKAVDAAPSARVVQVQPAPPVLPPSVQRLFSGFLLQAGVFTSPQRAEELHAKLTLSGVPSTLETRVQVGPFRTRQEAEAAQEKLRQLGVETVLVPPKR